jgi:hypothetical protein
MVSNLVAMKVEMMETHWVELKDHLKGHTMDLSLVDSMVESLDEMMVDSMVSMRAEMKVCRMDHLLVVMLDLFEGALMDVLMVWMRVVSKDELTAL